ncbi:minimal PKS acyl carrier protein [Kitasatospora sp. MAP12-15]|uniref:acyl carrier protein n=1 Tax=unclassified Kitasatospora TaxID=2633591 RepID=UPI00247705B3|nr:acyl carrier protein [Kitasatospora sp. MAP12-44]MDH6114993.1 minimal PKS acyl carrier protein [Kitasatospora sp. MAP12-44]
MNGPVTFEDLASLMKARAGLSVDPWEMESHPESAFVDYGLDSLGLLGIVSELENRFGLSIGNDPETCKTPHEFLDLVNPQLTSGA